MQQDPLQQRALQALENIRRRFHPELEQEEIEFIHQHIIGQIPELIILDVVLNQLNQIEPLVDDVDFDDIFRIDDRDHVVGAHNNQHIRWFDWEQLTDRTRHQ